MLYQYETNGVWAMKREDLGDLSAFATVARTGSFTQAARELNTSQSAVSHIVKRLEERVGARLLTRTTRHVATTELGEQLLRVIEPAIKDLSHGLEAVSQARERPVGTVRVTSTKWAAATILMPAATRVMATYPDIQIEISIDQRMVDIVAERFDAGVRLGEDIEQDMIGLRIGPDVRMAVAGTPDYFARYGRPQSPRDLTSHNCINLRLPTHGNVYVWEFEQSGRPLNVRVDGQFTCNDVDLTLAAALNGTGLVFLPEEYMISALSEGRLERALEEYCPPFPGYYLYYPSRRLHSRAFELFIDALRDQARLPAAALHSDREKMA
jgi:DNA-binding transcriptional LysR family regulator